MRPRGEVSSAILSTAQKLAYVDEEGRRRGPTLQELAQRACVGGAAALNTVKNLTRSGALVPVHSRRVPYRSRPVAEYAPGA